MCVTQCVRIKPAASRKSKSSVPTTEPSGFGNILKSSSRYKAIIEYLLLVLTMCMLKPIYIHPVLKALDGEV